MRQPSHTSRTGRKRRPLGADEIQVRVSISPVHRGDLVATETDLPDGSAGRRLGTEAAGVVTVVGPSVPALRVGDRVAVFPAPGAWSEHITVPAEAAAAVPDSLSDETASVLLVNTITSRNVLRAVNELRAAAAAPSDSPLLVSGAASALGKLIVQQARDRGWPVVAVVRSDRSASTVRTNWPDVPVVVSGSGGWQRELEGGRSAGGRCRSSPMRTAVPSCGRSCPLSTMAGRWSSGAI